MDHYNATVHNGALVSTRRGLHVSKTKHHGTRFVNTFAAPTTNSSRSAPSSGSHTFAVGGGRRDGLSEVTAVGSRADGKPMERKFKFVAKPREKTLGAPRGRPRTKLPKLPTPPSTSGSESGEDAANQVARAPRTSAAVSRLPPAPAAGSVDDMLAQAADEFFRQSPATAYLPKAWKTHLYGHDLPEMANHIAHMYLQNAPRQLYPYEELLTYNPVRSPHFFDRINRDSVTMAQCIMTSTAIESVRTGDISFKELSFHTTKLCSMLNDRLLDANTYNSPAIMEAVSAMAIVGMFMGRYDHWHVHMKGLRHIIERNGGMQPEWGHVLNKIRRADVKGAAYSGSMPYLEYKRFCSPISDVLTPEVRADLALNTQHLLQICGIEQINIESMRGLVFFAQTLKLARHAPAGTILFDPHAYTEDCLWVEHQLVRYPAPLRDQAPVDQRLIDHFSAIEATEQPPTMADTLSDATEDSPPSYVYFSAATAAVAAPAVNLLDPLLRIAAVLYIEELLPEARTIDSYSVLLSMLNNQVRIIVQRLHDREAMLTEPGFTLDGLPHTAAMRPVLIWVCMVAYSLGSVVDNESAYRLPPMDRSPFQDCMALIVGPTAADVDALHHSDFELCRLLAVQELRAITVDDRSLLKQIVSDYETRAMMAYM